MTNGTKKLKLPSKRERMALLMNGVTVIIAVGAYIVMVVTNDSGIAMAASTVAAAAYGALGWVKSKYIAGETERPSTGTGYIDVPDQDSE